MLFISLNLQRFLILCVCFSALCSAEQAVAQSSKNADVLPLEVVGKAKAMAIVEVVPYVQGIVLSKNFKLGEEVKTKQVLVKLDPESFQIKVDRAKTLLKNARFALETIDKEFKRIAGLIERKLTPLRGLYELKVARDIAMGEVEEVKGRLKQAEFELSRTIIKSPIDGFVSQEEVDVGDLVDRGLGKIMTLVRYNPIRVIIGIDQTTDIKLYKHKIAGGEVNFEFRLELPTGEKYPHPGKYQGFYHRVDPKTGKVEHELVFPNPDLLILPGQTVKIRVTEKDRAKSN
jgi:membrane fusion protein (multidrug efflux system)